VRLFGRRKPAIAETPPKVSVAELKRRLDRGEDVVVLDVRQPHAYAEFPGDIPGSVRIPPPDVPTRYDEIPRNRLVVPYCT
jgi:adenylyltransferase/sulfurtransferase